MYTLSVVKERLRFSQIDQKALDVRELFSQCFNIFKVCSRQRFRKFDFNKNSFVGFFDDTINFCSFGVSQIVKVIWQSFVISIFNKLRKYKVFK